MIKKRKGRSKNPTRMYFHAGTQDAIVRYQNSETSNDKNKIYSNEISPAFEKLAENLINIHRFTSLHDSFDDLKNDCVNFLFETLLKFDPSRGTNAFSYFNVCAKNFLIIKTKKKLQITRRSVSMDDHESLNFNDHMTIEDSQQIPSQEVVFERASMATMLVKILYSIRDEVKTENELICINSIITIFESVDHLDLMNKSAILLYMRELSGLSPKQLTTTLQCVKRLYKEARDDEEAEDEFFL